jgi:hypothetical protein
VVALLFPQRSLARRSNEDRIGPLFRIWSAAATNRQLSRAACGADDQNTGPELAKVERRRTARRRP